MPSLVVVSEGQTKPSGRTAGKGQATRSGDSLLLRRSTCFVRAAEQRDRVGCGGSPPGATTPRVGRVDNVNTLAGRYRLIAVVGRGGMGIVWRARDERLDRDVAVKVLHAWVADDPDLRRRFEDEARLLAGLQHAHVVRLYDVARHEGNAVLVMELVEGDSFATLVAGGRRLPWATAAALCRPVAEALAYAHARGIVHRDLTAANVLVESASGRVVVSDFGLARLLRTSPGTPGSTLIAGTPEYWSPEQAAGRTPDAATDVYALGCLLFRLVTGRLPFEGDDRLAAGSLYLHRARS